MMAKRSGTFAKVNPFSRTPATVDGDGSALIESLTILHNIGAHGLEKGLCFAQGSKEFDQLN